MADSEARGAATHGGQLHPVDPDFQDPDQRPRGNGDTEGNPLAGFNSIDSTLTGTSRSPSNSQPWRTTRQVGFETSADTGCARSFNSCPSRFGRTPVVFTPI